MATGRPKTGTGEQIGMRWQQAPLHAVDAWREEQWDKPSRAEAIRRLVQGCDRVDLQQNRCQS